MTSDQPLRKNSPQSVELSRRQTNRQSDGQRDRQADTPMLT